MSWIFGEGLPMLVAALRLDARRIGIAGHSMGGDGAPTLTLRHHVGHDHGDWFVQSFVDDHLRRHAERLAG
jgi:S-formylglutathione hydrolase FrmB